MVDAINSSPAGSGAPLRISNSDKLKQVTSSEATPSKADEQAPDQTGVEKSKEDPAVTSNSIKADERVTRTKESLGIGEAVVGAAISATTEIGNLLSAAITVAEDASDEGLDAEAREEAQKAFTQITQNIDETAKGASFEGFNLVDPGARDITVLTTESGVDIESQAEKISSAGLGIDKLSMGTAASADHAAAKSKEALSHTTSALARFGATATRISELGTAEIQATLSADELLPGVDASLSSAAAEKLAAQVKEALSQTGLNIANAKPEALGAATA